VPGTASESGRARRFLGVDGAAGTVSEPFTVGALVSAPFRLRDAVDSGADGAGERGGLVLLAKAARRADRRVAILRAHRNWNPVIKGEKWSSTKQKLNGKVSEQVLVEQETPKRVRSG
jgi:hypothetical protein